MLDILLTNKQWLQVSTGATVISNVGEFPIFVRDAIETGSGVRLEKGCSKSFDTAVFAKGGCGGEGIYANIIVDGNEPLTAPEPLDYAKLYDTEGGNGVVRLNATDTAQLVYKTAPYTSASAPIFASSDDLVATISATGLVTAVATGNALVSIADDNGKLDFIEIEVA